MTIASHQHGDVQNQDAKLGLAFIVSLIILAVELYGAYASGSLALFADAAHMATDAAAAGIALFAARLARRQRTHKQTFGYGRSTVIAALINASTLIAVALYLAGEAIRRISEPHPVASNTMLVVAVIALVGNGLLSLYLARGGGGKSLNVRAVIVHLAGDAAASGAVIIGAILIALTGGSLIDPILTILISMLVAWSAFGLFRESTDILMERAPGGVDAEAIRTALLAVNGIDDVHDVHVWSIDGEQTAASLHVSVSAMFVAAGPNIVGELKPLLQARFGIQHTTIEIECDNCASPNCEP